MFLDSLAVSYRAENRTICENVAQPDWPEIQRVISQSRYGPFQMLSLQDDSRQLLVRKLETGDSYEIVSLTTASWESACLETSASFTTVVQAVKAFVLG